MSFDEFCMVLCVISLVSVWLGGYAPAFSWKMGIGAACWTFMSGMGSITMRRRLVQSRLVKKARLLCRKTVPAFNTHTLQWLLAAWPGVVDLGFGIGLVQATFCWIGWRLVPPPPGASCLARWQGVAGLVHFRKACRKAITKSWAGAVAHPRGASHQFWLDCYWLESSDFNFLAFHGAHRAKLFCRRVNSNQGLSGSTHMLIQVGPWFFGNAGSKRNQKEHHLGGS